MNEAVDDRPGAIPEQPGDAAATRRLPLRPGDLVDLLTRPRRFFSGHLDLSSPKVLVPVVWLLGISSRLDGIDTDIVRNQMGSARASWALIEPIVSGSWTYFWLFCAGAGVISGALIYLVGGWWYRLRVSWSGAGKDVDRTLPRILYCWSGLVVSLPYVLLTVGYTFAYPNYLAAYNGDELFSLALPVLMFWSVGVSYIAVTSNYDLTPWKATLWFLVLPILFYLAALGLFVYLLAFLS